MAETGPVCFSKNTMMRKFTMLLAVLWTAAVSACAQTIEVNGKDPGRVFEGIGMLSAGASSRLLYDYPEPYRSDILDFLFKPGFGASLPQLKVEFGGDINSTDGSELCYAHTREEFDHPKPWYFDRGYEAWLIREAKKRNPGIKVEILQWGAPGWVGNGHFYSDDNALLIADYIKGLKQYQGIDIDYTGIRNETMYDIAWIKRLRQVLDSSGLQSVKIDAGDQWRPGNQWRIGKDIAADPVLAKDVYAVNAHVPEETNFVMLPQVRQSGKPIWSGESHQHGGDWYAAAKAARVNNQAYPLGRITRIIYWSLITSYPDYLTAPASGLMKANTPWSGHYEVQPPLWIAAHLNQFAHPGWKFLDGACRDFGDKGWSVISLEDTATRDYTIVMETMQAKEPQTVHFRVAGGLSDKPLSVWASVFKQFAFRREADIVPHNGEFTLTVPPNAIYSLTTRGGQRKGAPAHPIPAPRAFFSSYRDDFDHDSVGKEPPYFINYHGAFEVDRDPRSKNRFLHQCALSQGLNWFHQPYPRIILGDSSWRETDVQVDFMLPDTGSVGADCRLHDFSWNSKVPGYGFRVHSGGAWELITCQDGKVLRHGTLPPLGKSWHRLRFKADDSRLEAWVDGKPVAALNDTAFDHGVIGLTTGWNEAFFDHFSVSHR